MKCYVVMNALASFVDRDFPREVFHVYLAEMLVEPRTREERA